MAIVIDNPGLEGWIQERMELGQFECVDEVLLDALRHSDPQFRGPAKSVAEVFALARGLCQDLDIGRDPSIERPVEF